MKSTEPTHRIAERSNKPGYYLVVSREFIGGNDDISTVICAPFYREVLGLATEVVVGPEQGIPRVSAVRCDFLTLMFKDKLTTRAGRLFRLKTSGAEPSPCSSPGPAGGREQNN